MLININNKPIRVKEESEEQPKDWVLFGVKLTGFTLILYLLDYVCFTFFYYHPLPWIRWVGEILSWIS